MFEVIYGGSEKVLFGKFGIGMYFICVFNFDKYLENINKVRHPLTFY